jgi:hypothetical protein
MFLTVIQTPFIPFSKLAGSIKIPIRSATAKTTQKNPMMGLMFFAIKKAPVKNNNPAIEIIIIVKRLIIPPFSLYIP